MVKEDRLILAGGILVAVMFYATPLFPLWLIAKGLQRIDRR